MSAVVGGDNTHHHGLMKMIPCELSHGARVADLGGISDAGVIWCGLQNVAESWCRCMFSASSTGTRRK